MIHCLSLTWTAASVWKINLFVNGVNIHTPGSLWGCWFARLFIFYSALKNNRLTGSNTVVKHQNMELWTIVRVNTKLTIEKGLKKLKLILLKFFNRAVKMTCVLQMCGSLKSYKAKEKCCHLVAIHKLILHWKKLFSKVQSTEHLKLCERVQITHSPSFRFCGCSGARLSGFGADCGALVWPTRRKIWHYYWVLLKNHVWLMHS